MKHDAREAVILEASDDRGRQKRLTPEEEKPICEVEIKFQNKWKPLIHACIFELAAALIRTLDLDS